MDQAERDRRRDHAEDLRRGLAEAGVSVVATSFVDNAGISRVKSVPLDRLPHLAAWGVGFSPAFDYFRADDWVAAPASGEGPVGDQRIIPDLDRLVVLDAQPGWAWAPGERYEQSGAPYAADSRLLLRRLVDDLAAPRPDGARRARDRVGRLRGRRRRLPPRPPAGLPTGWPGWPRCRTTAATCWPR